jgi:small Trp-rich protein
MWFVLIGVIMIVMNFAGIGPIGAWTWTDKWLVFLFPFACAAVWWAIADSTGYYQRKAQEKMDQKKVDRRNRSLESIAQRQKEEEALMRGAYRN